MSRAPAAPIAVSPSVARSDPAVPRAIEARSLAELATIRVDWETLRERAFPLSSNAEPGRYRITVESLGAGVRPHCVVFHDGDRPIGAIIARAVRRPAGCRFGYLTLRTPRLNCLEIVYGGLLTDASEAARSAITLYLSEALQSGRFDHILVNHIPSDDPLCASLAALGMAASHEEPHWSARLVPGSYDKTMAHHSSKHRSKLRRYDRLLCEAFGDDVELRAYTTPEGVGPFLDASTPIAERTYQAELGVAVTDTPLRRAVLTHEAQAGRFRSYVLFGGGKPIAYQNGAVYGDRYLCDGRGYLPEHRDLRPGNILSLRIMADLCEQGLSWVDYGFGDAEYKRVYATDKWSETTLRLYGGTVRARVAAAMDRTAGIVSRSANRLASSGLLSRIKRSWRRKLTKSSEAAE